MKYLSCMTRSRRSRTCQVRSAGPQLLFLALCISYIVVAFLCTNIKATARPTPRRMTDARWIATSNSLLDRLSCRWMGICGGANWFRHWWASSGHPPAIYTEQVAQAHPAHDFSDAWIDPSVDPDSWSKKERQLRSIPSYVLEYAPLVHLYDREKYWPSDIAEHLEHTYVKLDNGMTPDYPVNLSNLADLNQYDGEKVFLTSKDDVEADPPWLLSRHNIPRAADDEEYIPIEYTEGTRSGKEKNVKERARKEGWGFVNTHLAMGERETKIIEGDADSDAEEPAFEIKLPKMPPTGSAQRVLRQRRPSSSSHQQEPEKTQTFPGLRSNAPGFLICIEKGDGIIDAFWFYFYSFNEGNTVLGMRFGNHVGDWEHTMVRFQNGQPKGVFLSRHSWGGAYTYEALEKVGKRPVVFAGDGSHAHYSSPGRQDYILPLGLLHDLTSRGPLWDPVQNLKSYTYDIHEDLLRASLDNPRAPTSWFHYEGRWGDKHYDLDDPRQYRFLGEYHYANGPSGPKFKSLARATLCGREECDIKDIID